MVVLYNDEQETGKPLDKGGTFQSFSLARYEGDDWKGEISGWTDENQVTVEDSGLCDILEAESQGQGCC